MNVINNMDSTPVSPAPVSPEGVSPGAEPAAGTEPGILPFVSVFRQAMAAEVEDMPGALPAIPPLPVLPEASAPEGKVSTPTGNLLPPVISPTEPVSVPVPDIGFIVRQALAAEALPMPSEASGQPPAPIAIARPTTPAAQAVLPLGANENISALLPPASQFTGGELAAVPAAIGQGTGAGAGAPTISLELPEMAGPIHSLTANPAPVSRESSAVPGTLVSVPAAFQQPSWGEAFGERIHWLVTQRVQSAQMVLNPPELGPIDVRLKFHQGDASVVFTTANSVVREAIEAALPQLREMLADSGIRLADASIEHRQPEAGRHSDRAAGSPRGQSGENGAEPKDDIVTRLPPDSLLDIYV